MRIRSIEDVVASQLCCGCGACAYVEPARYRMADAPRFGRRPFPTEGAAAPSGDGLAVCPGVGLAHDFDASSGEHVERLAAGWGPVRSVFEGHARDPEVRHLGSSGGAATALSLFCLEQLGMHGVLHTAARPDAPYLNETVFSRSRDALLAATGSRYSPASPCEGLGLVEAAPGPCVFVGKPCDVAAASKARRLRPRLDERLGLTIAFFCAGTPSTSGTLEMLRQMGVADPTSVRSLRYRGMGWPGMAAAEVDVGSGPTSRRELTYAQSWGEILQKHRQWRCYVCLDHSGEFADLAVGDPWHRPVSPGDPGRSLIVVRTARGREVLEGAVRAGYLVAEPSEPDCLPASQPRYQAMRGQVWARNLVCRLLGAAAPRYRRMPQRRFWWRELTLGEKLRSFAGTARRVFRKGLRRRLGEDELRAP